MLSVYNSGTVTLKAEPVSGGTYSVRVTEAGLSVPELTANVWEAGNTGPMSRFYRFSVQSGKRYVVTNKNRLDYNNSWGSSSVYGYSYLSAFKDDGKLLVNTVDEAYGGSSSYGAPRLITADADGYIIVKVRPYELSSNTDYYANPYYEVAFGEVVALTADSLRAGNLAAGGMAFYSFDALADIPYAISWEDALEQSGSAYTADVMVTAWRGSDYYWEPASLNRLFAATDSGYAAPQAVSYSGNTPVIIRVEGKTKTEAGTFAVKYK